MCRPAKRPKPLATAPFAPVKADEQVQAPPMFEDMKESSDVYASLCDFLEVTAKDIFESWQTPASAEMEPRPKTFVYTTYDMVSAPENAVAVGFSHDGLAIEIRDTTILSEKILPKYFRHKNVTSFYRQLNSYGFRTTRSASADIAHTFSHELFRQGRADLLPSIVRKKCIPKDKSAGSKDNSNRPVKKPSSPSADDTDAGSISSAVGSPRSDFESSSSASKPETQDVMKMIEELRESQLKAQERALALEAHNRRMAEENRAILVESENIFRTMNKLVENQTAAIGKLFGPEASKAFAEQAKPFRFDFEPLVTSDLADNKPMSQVVQTQAQDFKEFVGESNDFVFEDEDLQLLENIFVSPDSWDASLVA